MRNFFDIDSPVMRFLTKLCDLMILNFLCVICCIPVITIGASVTALYSVNLKMARGEESYIIKSFFKSFKENFRISTTIWLILAVIGVLFYFDYKAIAFLPDSMRTLFYTVVGAAGLIYLLFLVYIFAYIARFENTIKNTMKNTILIAIGNLPYSVLLVGIPVCCVVLTFLNNTTFVYGTLVWILFGFSGISYLSSIYFRKIFEKYEPKDEEETEE